MMLETVSRALDAGGERIGLYQLEHEGISKVLARHMLENYLAGTASGYEEVLENAASGTAVQVNAVAGRIAEQAPLSAESRAAVIRRFKELQDRAGYPGDYVRWMQRMRLPVV